LAVLVIALGGSLAVVGGTSRWGSGPCVSLVDLQGRRRLPCPFKAWHRGVQRRLLQRLVIRFSPRTYLG
jgi:hypothetical protein